MSEEKTYVEDVNRTIYDVIDDDKDSFKLEQGLTEDILKLGRLVLRVALDNLSCLWVELAWRMPDGLIVFGRGIAVSFLRVQMQQLGAFHVLQLSQDAHQLLHVVSVERSEVAYVHALEDVLLLGNGTLDGIGQSDESLASVFLQHAL